MSDLLKLYAYVLECSNNKYYVGIGYNPSKRIASHFSESMKRGSVFTRIYKPIKCIATYDLNTESYQEAELYENLLTIHYSKIYGSENVAGGNFVVRDTLIRKKGIDNCIKLNEISVHGKTYKLSQIDILKKITQIEIPTSTKKESIAIEPLDFNLIYDKTAHIEPLKKRLLIVLSLIYRTKASRMVKIRLGCIHRSSMTISIPKRKRNFYIEYPMEDGLLRLIELYYRNEKDKPTDYLFMSKHNKSKRMGTSDEDEIRKEIIANILAHSKIQNSNDSSNHP